MILRMSGVFGHEAGMFRPKIVLIRVYCLRRKIKRDEVSKVGRGQSIWAHTEHNRQWLLSLDFILLSVGS